MYATRRTGRNGRAGILLSGSPHIRSSASPHRALGCCGVADVHTSASGSDVAFPLQSRVIPRRVTDENAPRTFTEFRRRACGSNGQRARIEQACSNYRTAQPLAPVHERYDAGMTKSKIAISLPKDQLARVHREVRAGRADSVSGYIARVLAEHEKRESLRALLRDLTDQYGQPTAKDLKWAERALTLRRA